MSQVVRNHLTLRIRTVRSLLSALMVLPWKATPGHPVLAAVQLLNPSYEQGARELPATPAIDLGRVWRALLSGADREQAFRAFEVATLLALRRALRNGTVWIDHSLAFRSREQLFIPAEIWEKERNAYYRRLSLPKTAESYLEPLIERAQPGVAAVAKAVEAGELRVDDELHLTPLAAARRSKNDGTRFEQIGLFAWRPEKSQGDLAPMKADAGDDCELVPPSSRYGCKTLKRRVAGGER